MGDGVVLYNLQIAWFVNLPKMYLIVCVCYIVYGGNYCLEYVYLILFTTFPLSWILFFAKTGKFQVQSGGENFSQYGPGPAAWGAYDMQRAQGHR